VMPRTAPEVGVTAAMHRPIAKTAAMGSTRASTKPTRFRVIRDIDASAAHGPYPDYLARAHARAGISHAVTEAREAIRILVPAHGASSFAETSDLQRIWRDAEVASRHAIVSPETSADLFGSALVGLPQHNVTALV
jgi:3-hydroxy-9,10-secoandrosta-1,3,5(10)-triene-9,17-dione monooxygenase